MRFQIAMNLESDPILKLTPLQTSDLTKSQPFRHLASPETLSSVPTCLRIPS
jgi:hypothetical protein